MSSTANQTKASKAISTMYASLGVSDYAGLSTKAHGIGAAITKADETLATARAALAESLPVAVTYAYVTKVGRVESDKIAAPFLGVKSDAYAMYAIAGALLSHGHDSFQGRADVIEAVRNGASKPDLFAAACESVTAFRAVAKAAKAAKAADKADKAPKTDGDKETTAPTVSAPVTPESRGHDLVVAISGPASAMVKGLSDGSVKVTPEDFAALRTILVALGQASGTLRSVGSTAPKATKSA